MTNEERLAEWFRSRPKWGNQDVNGFDLDQIRANLRLTPTERFEKFFAFVEFALEVKRAGKAAGLHRVP